MLIIGEGNWTRHRPWAIATLVAWLAGFFVYFRHPGILAGRSRVGLICGFAATAIFIFEWCYALRRRSSWDRNVVTRSVRWCCGPLRALFDRQPTSARLRQHIWLGLISVPLVYLHSGRRWGGEIPTILFVVFMATIVSGLVGLFLQQWVPRLLRLEISGEAIYSRIPETLSRIRWESEFLVAATCGPLTLSDHPIPGRTVWSKDRGPSRVESMKVHRSGLGAGLLDHVPASPVSGSGPLLEFYKNQLDPFLAEPSSSSIIDLFWRMVVGFVLPLERRNVLWSRGPAQAEFWKLRSRLEPATHEVVAALERACELRRQLEYQARLHTLLHHWLVIHLPTAIALFFLLGLHIFTALKYQ